MKKEIIRITNLNYYYKDSNNNKKHILKNIDFTLFENENLCIIGQTGCGKTTLVKTLIGIIPDNANYSFNEYNKFEGKMGLVLQDSNTSLNPTLKIRTQFNLFLKEKYGKLLRNQLNEKIVSLLKDVNINNIEEVIEKYALELSRGMNQRITIALALINEPNVLILDEPTSAIDASNREILLKLIIELKKKYKMTVIYITHDLKLAEKIADRIMIMKNGEIVETVNKMNDIFDYKNDYSKKLKQLSVLNSKDDFLYKKEKLIEVNNIYKSFNGKPVLEDISFSLFQDDTLGIVGPSGSGKSTLCKILVGIYDKDSGSILKNNNMIIDIVNQDAKISLDPNMKIFDILNEKKYINKNKPFSKKRIQYLFDDFNLPLNLLDKYSYELSGGQRQLILIIRSILYNSEIIILDEPTSSLDVETQKLVLDKLKLIKRKYGITYIFISHDIDVINYMCNRVIYIKKQKNID